jgi:iron complex transport system ATP-binding protein
MRICLNKISFAYDTASIIKEVHCSFESGNFYSILGPNGSGKTTLLDLISGFLKPFSGYIEIDKAKVLSISKKELAKKIALVSQDYTINFPFMVKDVVMMGRHPYIPRFSVPSTRDFKKVEHAMESCGINHLKNRKVNELSGGERQRCVFARALCQDTETLLLDEAFSSMDINHTLQMLTLIKKSVRQEKKLVISVFHDLNLASSFSDELLMIKNGEIKAFGKSEEIMTQDNIKNVFGVESVVEFNDHAMAKQVYYPTI